MEKRFKQGGWVLVKREILIANQQEGLTIIKRERDQEGHHEFTEAEMVLPAGSGEWNGLRKAEHLISLEGERVRTC